MNSTPTSLESAYLRLGPLLVGALGRLARSGFVASPPDAQDLIHDFFLEVFPGLLERYQPRQGSFEGYAYRAFVQFSRPRIIRQGRLQRDLLDPVLLDGLRSPESPPDRQVEDRFLHAALEDGMARLPGDLRWILHAYCFSGFSERELARQLGISRYKLRERLIEALGRVTVELPQPGEMPDLEWAVARSIWKEQRSLKETARLLHVTEHQAHVAYKKCISILSEILKQYSQPGRGEMVDPTQIDLADVLSLLTKALLSKGDLKLLEQVRARGPEILTGLSVADSAQDPLANLDAGTLDAEWAGQVYEAVAGPAGDPGASEEDLRALFEARHSDLAAVGAAFEEALMINLPDELKTFEHCFSEIVPVSESDREQLLRQPDVQASEAARRMVFYGITPASVLTATDAVSRLADRMIVRGLKTSPLLLSVENSETLLERQQFDFFMASSEVEKTVRCSDVVAISILRWCIGIAQYKPLLFDLFESRAETRFGVTMSRTDNEEPNLFKRWGYSEVPDYTPRPNNKQQPQMQP